MKGYLKGILAISYTWLIIVFLVIFLAAVPAIPGSLLIKLPGPDDWTTTESGGVVNLTANVSIYNGGFFTMDDFYFILQLHSGNGSVIAEFTSPKVDIPPGPWTTFPVYFLLNESATTSEQVQQMFFSTVNYGGLVYFNAEYLMDFRIQLGVNATVSVGPLVRDFQADMANATVSHVGDQYLLDVPFWIDSARVLSGSTLFVNGTVSNATQQLGTFKSTAKMGAITNGTMVVVLSQEAYQHLQTSPDTLLLNCTYNFQIYQWQQDYTVQWTPGGANAESLQSDPMTAPAGGWWDDGA
jgi:hypothetical protein